MQKILNAYKNEIKLTESLIKKVNWKDQHHYTEWLAQTFYYAAYSTRIIGLAGCHFGYSQNNLHQRFLEHAKEEKNHEKILITDLAHFGQKLSDFDPSPMAKMLYQNQYYWIQHQGPLSVYGYFLFLEGLAVEFGPEIYKRIAKVFPANAIKYLKVHVEEDHGHIESHLKLLADATPEDYSKIVENMQLTGAAYRKFLEDIIQAADYKKSQSNKAAKSSRAA